MILTAVLCGTAAFLTGFNIGTLRKYKAKHLPVTRKAARTDTELERQNLEYRKFLYYDGTLTEREK